MVLSLQGVAILIILSYIMKPSYGKQLQNICHIPQKAKGPEASWESFPDRALKWASQGDEGEGLGWLDRHLCPRVIQQHRFLLPLLTLFLSELAIQITKQPSHQLWSHEITPAWAPCLTCNRHRMISTTGWLHPCGPCWCPAHSQRTTGILASSSAGHMFRSDWPPLEMTE